MLTRCPACATHFRVTPEQLKARGGRVRCGQCQDVFNALDSLIEEPVVVTAPLVAVAPAPTFAASVETPVEAPAEPPAGTLAEPIAETLPDPALQAGTGPSAETAPESFPEEAPAEPPALTPDALEEPVPATTGTAATAPEEPAVAGTGEPVAGSGPGEDTDAAADWSSSFPAAAPPPRRWPWVGGSLLAFAAIALQAALAFRVELAVLWPQARPALATLCEIADCEVGLPAKVALVGIEASDLHPDSAHKDRLALAATLKNRAPFAQQFPHLELTLTDTADQAIARKVLAPADYLPPATSVAGGMAPNADIAIAIGIDAGGLPASGYRLYLFYP